MSEEQIKSIIEEYIDCTEVAGMCLNQAAAEIMKLMQGEIVGFAEWLAVRYKPVTNGSLLAYWCISYNMERSTKYTTSQLLDTYQQSLAPKSTDQ